MGLYESIGETSSRLELFSPDRARLHAAASTTASATKPTFTFILQRLKEYVSGPHVSCPALRPSVRGRASPGKRSRSLRRKRGFKGSPAS
jgi:hypothetical protein